jgi:predicted negative regulator of RcsB-dependent stress response
LIKPYDDECHVNIAWFKLAELVERGEKERAFSIYRLLIHPWNDEAYAAQLKGDLYYAFRDCEKACESYHKAVSQYELSGRVQQATFVYERLLSTQRVQQHRQ